jgi:hypothetical protein
MSQVPVDSIAEAFSRTAEKYDSFAQDHPHLTRMRAKVYAHVMRHVLRGAHILELNAGTGTDAVQLAQRGYYVHATDIAPGMLNRLQEKVNKLGLEDWVTMEARSFLSLEGVPGDPQAWRHSDLGSHAAYLLMGNGGSLSWEFLAGIPAIVPRQGASASRGPAFRCVLFFTAAGPSMVWT